MKVLVTAASRHGTTAEIAEAIAKVLRAAHLEVDVIPPDDVHAIADYDAVVLGSGVYAGHWLKPARAFVDRHAHALQETTVFLFSSGPIGDPPRPLEDPAEIASIDEATMALDHRVFAGRLTESDLGAGERLIIKMVRAPFGDFRSWDDITDWATAIASFVNSEEKALLSVVD
jgi:menaquinone-dependent protoporphyrinogen oxidase